MSFTSLAGIGGIGFVLLGVVINAGYVRARLPLPGVITSLATATDEFAAVGDGLKRPSVLVPLTWLGLTVFAAGLLAVLWRYGPAVGAWALVGFGGVLMQNATFTVVEALRFGMATAATHHRGSVAGLWGASNVLFGFNPLFLATALLGFTTAGTGADLIASWHAWLGYLAAALLFVSSLASPYNVDGTNRLALVGLVGWLGWAAWIVVSSVTLLLL